MSNGWEDLPSGGSGGSNASVGTNGVTAPSSSTEIAFINSSGNLQPVSPSNPLPVDIHFDTVVVGENLAQVNGQTVNVGTGASGSGTQRVAVASDSSITANAGTNLNTSALALETGGNLAAINTKTPALGQALAAASAPVVLPATQITALTPPTTVTVQQSTASALNATVVGLGTAGTPSGGVVSIQGVTSGTVVPVSFSYPSGNQNINIADFGGTNVTLGSQASTASMPVVIASDQSAISTTRPDLDIIGQSAQTATVNNIIPGTAGTSATDVSGYRSASIQIFCPAGTYTTGAIIFEGTNDSATGTIFQTIPVYNQIILTGTPITAAITLATTTSIIYSFPINFRYLRVRISTAVSGASASVQAFSRFSQSAWTPAVFQTAQATAANLATTATIASGTVTAVTTVGTITNGVPLAGKASANAPVQNLYSTTNVTTSAYVQLIASTTSATTFVDCFDSSGQTMILATGTSGSEVIKWYIPPGGGQIPFAIPASTRVAIKALTANATTGYINLNLFS